MKIPQNNLNSFFILSKNNQLSALSIKIDWKSPIDVETLYLIIKNIIHNERNVVFSIYLGGSFFSEEIKTKMFKVLKINIFKKMSLTEFYVWFEENFNDDERYLEQFEAYEIGIILDNKTKSWIENTMYPEYPWNENFKKTLIHKYAMTEKLKEQQKEINKLKKKNKLLFLQIKKIKTWPFRKKT